MDIISIHCPFTSHIENLLKLEAIRRMKKSVIVINDKNLCQAINLWMMAGTAIDVLALEPPPENIPT